MEGLTPKQEAFAFAFVELGNGHKAYERAYNAGKMSQGSIDTEASELLRHPRIAHRVLELRAAAATETVLDLSYVINGFKNIYEQCSEGIDRDPTGANKALENIGKLLGLYVEHKVVKNLNVNVRADMDRLPDHKLLALIASGELLLEDRARKALTEADSNDTGTSETEA